MNVDITTHAEEDLVPAAAHGAGKQPAGRRALVDAAKQILVEQVPSSVTGRELAERAGVNYGLVHHYFGGKDQVFSEALLELRAEFIESMPDQTLPVLLTDQHNPFLRAVALSFADYPSTLGPTRDHIIGAGVTAGVRRRLENTHRLDTTTAIDVEAKARAFVLMCVQLGNGIYREMLMDSVGANGSARDAVDAVVQSLYRELALTTDSV